MTTFFLLFGQNICFIKPELLLYEQEHFSHYLEGAPISYIESGIKK